MNPIEQVHKAEAAAREALADTEAPFRYARHRKALIDLLAALDAARGEAIEGVFLVDGEVRLVASEYMRDVAMRRGALPLFAAPQAPPAALAWILRTGHGTGIHIGARPPVENVGWRELTAADIKDAPPAALAVPLTPDVLLDMAEPLRPLLHTPEHWRMVREYGGAVAAAALAQRKEGGNG